MIWLLLFIIVAGYTVASHREIIMFLNERDQIDSSRKHSPLMKAEDAIEVDTTDLKIEEQVNYIINIVNYNQKGT